MRIIPAFSIGAWRCMAFLTNLSFRFFLRLLFIGNLADRKPETVLTNQSECYEIQNNQPQEDLIIGITNHRYIFCFRSVGMGENYATTYRESDTRYRLH